MIDPVAVTRRSKAWGFNQAVHQNDSFELHHAFIHSDGYSSCHYHKNKYNLFYVLYGTLMVHFYGDEVSANNGAIAYSVTLEPGDKLVVPPKVWHRFQALNEYVDLLEAYWVHSVDPEDIVRKDVGGVYSKD